MSNPRNSGTLTGRLAGDPQVFNNSDGSKKVRFTLMVDRNFVSKATNERDSDAIDAEAFINKATNGLGPYANVHKGDLVQVQTTLRKDVYAKNGQTVYDLKVVAEEITYLEPKSVTQARMDKRVQDAEAQNRALQTQALAQAPVPAAAAAPATQGSPVANDEQLPFG